MPKSIFIIGAGAIGTALFSQLSKHSQAQLISRSDWPKIASQVFPKDSLIFIATKAYHLKEVVPLLAPHIDSTHQIVFCQNGIGILKEADPQWAHQCSRMTCWFGSRFIQDGSSARTVQVTGFQKIELMSSSSSHSIEEVLRLAGYQVDLIKDIPTLEWRKGIGNITINAICALAGEPNHMVVDDPDLRRLADEVFSEALKVAHALGIGLKSSDKDYVFETARATGKNLNSMLLDLREGRQTEIKWLNGAVIEAGRKLGIPTPANLAVYSLVQYLSSKKSEFLLLK